jgi:hypothetical protein
LWIRCLREINNLMKIKSLIIICLCLFSTLSFSQKPKKKVHRRAKKVKIISGIYTEPQIREETINQGVCGSIVWKSGNSMPSPDQVPVKSKPVQRELFVYDLTNTDQATLQNGFYKAIVTNLIKSVKSDSEGKGRYSLFVKEGDKGLYANQFDGEGNIFPVKISKDKVSIIVFTIDYQAVY